MSSRRCLCDFIILTTIPHLLTLYYSINDVFYTIILLAATFSSILWHKSHETSLKLLYIDYSCAVVLALYEIYKSKNKVEIVYINLGLFTLNKSMDVLSKYRILKYSKSHCIYHIMSCYKTFYIARNAYSS